MSNDINILLLIVFFTLVILAGGIFFLSSQNTLDQTSNIPAKSHLLVRPNSTKLEATDSAKLTIVEFGDYQCPACAAAHPALKRLLEEKGNSITFVFRHFPLAQHKNAFDAARAAEASGEQGMYFKMHDTLYENQIEWAEISSPKEIFIRYAQNLRLDVEKFKSDLSSGKYDDKIRSDYSDGVSLGIQGTPTFYFNGEKYEGNFSYEAIKENSEKFLGS